MWLQSFQTAGQQHLTPLPHLPPSPPSSPASPTASHRSGQEPSEEPGNARADGQAVSGVNSGPLWPTSRKDGSLFLKPAWKRWDGDSENSFGSELLCAEIAGVL